MHLLVLGGSGRTGKLIVEEAIRKGHSVVALVRSPSSLAARPGLMSIQGTPMQCKDITRAFRASPTPPEAVLVALSLKRVSDSPFAAISPDAPDRFMENSVANAIAVMKDFGTKRIIILSQWGAGNSFGSANFLFRAMFRYTNMRYGLAAHNAVDEETRQAGVEFVLARACVLADGDAAPIQLYPDNGEAIGFLAKITRASVAKFMIEASEKDDFIGKSPVISN
ncbi:NAD-dependent epimerase/dehydratase-like protein [Nemania sp. FL0031]|nr:NAD-dependent epimerase/dehydratase-like protein [Nemania sp. FL0031]